MAEFQGQSKLSLYIADETLWDLLTMSVATMKPAMQVFSDFYAFISKLSLETIYFKKI